MQVKIFAPCTIAPINTAIAMYLNCISTNRPLEGSCSDGSVKESSEANERTGLIASTANSVGINKSPALPNTEASEVHKARDFQSIQVPKSNVAKPVSGYIFHGLIYNAFVFQYADL